MPQTARRPDPTGTCTYGRLRQRIQSDVRHDEWVVRFDVPGSEEGAIVVTIPCWDVRRLQAERAQAIEVFGIQADG